MIEMLFSIISRESVGCTCCTLQRTARELYCSLVLDLILPHVCDYKPLSQTAKLTQYETVTCSGTRGPRVVPSDDHCACNCHCSARRLS